MQTHLLVFSPKLGLSLGDDQVEAREHAGQHHSSGLQEPCLSALLSLCCLSGQWHPIDISSELTSKAPITLSGRSSSHSRQSNGHFKGAKNRSCPESSPCQERFKNTEGYYWAVPLLDGHLTTGLPLLVINSLIPLRSTSQWI